MLLLCNCRDWSISNCSFVNCWFALIFLNDDLAYDTVNYVRTCWTGHADQRYWINETLVLLNLHYPNINLLNSRSLLCVLVCWLYRCLHGLGRILYKHSGMLRRPSFKVPWILFQQYPFHTTCWLPFNPSSVYSLQELSSSKIKGRLTTRCRSWGIPNSYRWYWYEHR